MSSYIMDEKDYLAHYGILRRSGRYPWGSGGHNAPEYNTGPKSFLDYIKSLFSAGFTEKQVAESVGVSISALRAAKSIAKAEQKQSDITQAQLLREKAMSYKAIGERMGLPESTVRSYLAPGANAKAEVLHTTANMLESEIAKYGPTDIGKGNEHHIGVTTTTFKNAVAVLKEKGYNEYYIKVPQLGIPGQYTVQKVLAPPGMGFPEVSANRGNIHSIAKFSTDHGKSFFTPKAPLSINEKRVDVLYGPEGGDKFDGVMFLRPGVKDLDMGQSRYAQVRVLVGKDHYLKGMAVYKDDLPDGVDIQFCTKKPNTGKKTDAMKKVGDDPENPFGALISRQIMERDKAGNEKVTSALNIVNEEGTWAEWSNNLSSQFLSKQEPALAKTQLAMSYERRAAEYKDIMSMTNPTVRKHLLDKYADSVDSSAVMLKAAALPRQAQHVILPVNSLKPNEVYAPNYNNGDKVILIRHPHGGTFEIPELTVNNRNRDAKRTIGDAKDAIGIHNSVAQRLSGADFDGDTVIVAKNTSGRVKSTPALEGLKNFDAHTAYPKYPGMKVMPAGRLQREMGDISNLITDMTIKGASPNELAAAVRHSMVVIDAVKHELNYKESARRNNIPALKAKYQGGANKGASTIVSLAKRDLRVPERKPRPAADGGPIDPATGRKMYVNTGRTYKNKKGETVFAKKSVKALAYVEDAHELVSKPRGTVMERLYADHSNKLKALANQARKSSYQTKRGKASSSAAKTYAPEVARLNSARVLAERNAPLERQAQVLANKMVREVKAVTPDMDKASEKKLGERALVKARAATGARKQEITISPREWEAIQAGAISPTNLENILKHADLEVVKTLARPKVELTMTSAMTNRAQAMLDSGYTRSEVAAALGISLTTLDTTTAVRDTTRR